MTNSFIEDITSSNFTEKEFPKIDKFVESLKTAISSGKITKQDLIAINQRFGEEFINNTIQGHGISKPFGYSGDFLIIDKIYTKHKSEIQKFAIWDEYFHKQAAPIAVRNRKTYFKELIKKKLTPGYNSTLLNIACGPARDLSELYDESSNARKNLTTTCIDMDQNAIEYATKLCKKHLAKIEFHNQNILKFSTNQKYDLVWSAGLFDYFNDKVFVWMLKNMSEWVKPAGEIVVGNFNKDNNPSRDYMELLGDWHLHHRTRKELKKLAIQAGFNAKNIDVNAEQQNVNLFLHIRL